MPTVLKSESLNLLKRLGVYRNCFSFFTRYDVYKNNLFLAIFLFKVLRKNTYSFCNGKQRILSKISLYYIHITFSIKNKVVYWDLCPVKK
jgi:hypothetical protein